MPITKGKFSANFALPKNLKIYHNCSPTSHLRNFANYMGLKGVDKDLCRQIFPIILGEIAENWFHSLECEKVNMWEATGKKFLTKCSYNEQPISLYDLNLIKQEEK